MLKKNHAENDALLHAAKIHSTFPIQIDFSCPNKAQAIYLIEGAAITNSLLILKMLYLSAHPVVLHLTRYVHECLDLIDHFSTDENEEDLQQWFTGKIISSPKASRKSAAEQMETVITTLSSQEVLQKMKTDKSFLHELKKNQARLLFDSLSTASHPSLDSVRFNCKKGSHVFDYECETTPYFPIEHYSFSTFVVIPLVQKIFAHPDLLKYDPKDWQTAKELLAKLNDS